MGGRIDNAGVEHWLADLPDGTGTRAGCPGLCSRWQGGRCGPRRIETVLGSRDGSCSVPLVWLELHAAALLSAGSRQVAVIIDPAHPAHISSLLMSAYGLTEQEQEVTSLVRGRSTAQIAAELVLSPLTVQEHLKAVFEKTDVCSRLELVGRIYFDHYEPRAEQRTSSH